MCRNHTTMPKNIFSQTCSGEKLESYTTLFWKHLLVIQTAWRQGSSQWGQYGRRSFAGRISKVFVTCFCDQKCSQGVSVDQILGPIFKQVICFTMAPHNIIARYLPFWHHMKWMRWMIFPLKFERETLTNWHWSRTIHIFLRDCRQPECLMEEKQFIAM